MALLLQESLNVYINWGTHNNMHLDAGKGKAMMMLQQERNQNVHHQPFNAGNRPIMFVKQFTYLGIVLADRMTLVPYFHMVKRNVKNKISIPSKI